MNVKLEKPFGTLFFMIKLINVHIYWLTKFIEILDTIPHLIHLKVALMTLGSTKSNTKYNNLQLPQKSQLLSVDRKSISFDKVTTLEQYVPTKIQKMRI